MPTDWIRRCPGAAYRIHENGAIEAEGHGFILWDPNGTAEEKLHVARIKKIWERWKDAILAATDKKGYAPAWVVAIIHNESSGDPKARAACEEKYCTALWKKGLCEAQGGPEKWCAGGLMAFTSATAAMYGHKGPNSWTYYIDHPEEMIVDSVDLMQNQEKACGDILIAAKSYNGGWCACAGGDIFGMGGQHKYSEQFARATNTFLSLYGDGLPETKGLPGWLVGAIFGAIGYTIYKYYDPKFGWTKRIRKVFAG